MNKTNLASRIEWGKHSLTMITSLKSTLPFSLILATTLSFSCIGCGVQREESSPDENPAPTPQTEAKEIKEMKVAEIAEALKNNESIVVVDVRTPTEFAEGHLKGASNIDFRAADFRTQLSALDTAKTYVVHCKSGGRSSQALATFEELGFQHILHMSDGFDSWAEAKMPVEKP